MRVGYARAAEARRIVANNPEKWSGVSGAEGGKKLGISKSAFNNIKKENGIRGAKSGGFRGHRKGPVRRLLDWEVRDLFSKWTRPPGMDAHLEYLREQACTD